jgi:hypothetical protein
LNKPAALRVCMVFFNFSGSIEIIGYTLCIYT